MEQNIKKIIDMVEDEEASYLEGETREQLMEMACLVIIRTMGIDQAAELIDILSAATLNGYENQVPELFPEFFHDTLCKVVEQNEDRFQYHAE